MIIYQVIVTQSDGHSYCFDSTIAVYLNQEDAELHAMYAEEKNRELLDKDLYGVVNPYDSDSYPNRYNGYSVEEIELKESFTIKE